MDNAILYAYYTKQLSISAKVVTCFKI